MISLIAVAPKHWFRFSHFFRVFHEFALLGPAQRNLLIDKGLIASLGDFYLGRQSPYADGKKQYPMMGNRMYPPKFDTVIQIVCLLLCSCHTPTSHSRWQRLTGDGSDALNEEQRKLLLREMLSPAALSWKDPATGYERLHLLSEQDKKLPHCRSLYDRIINEAQHSDAILEAVCSLLVHWSYEDQTYSREVVGIITEGVDKSGADQVRTFLAIMHRFILVADSQREYRLKQLHDPDPVAHHGHHQQQQHRHSQKKQGVLAMIKCYRVQHQPFSFECIKALAAMMAESEHYAKYMVSRRSEWAWWDMWIDNFVHRPSYLHNQEHQRLMAQKISFFEDQYIPLLAKHGIECQRSQIQQGGQRGMDGMYSGHRSHGSGAGYSDFNNNMQINDDYVQDPTQSAYDSHHYAHGINGRGGAQRTTNSVDDDDIYANDNGDDDTNEGGAVPGHDSGDDDDDDANIRMDVQDDEDDDVDLGNGDDAADANAQREQQPLHPV